MLAQKYPLLGSSVDPEKVSLTLKSLPPLIVSVGLLFNLHIDGTQVDTYVLALTTCVSAGFTLFGGLRRAYVYFRTRR